MFFVNLTVFGILANALYSFYGFNVMQAIIGALVFMIGPFAALDYFLKKEAAEYGAKKIIHIYWGCLLVVGAVGAFLAPNIWTYPRNSWVKPLSDFALLIGFSGPFVAFLMILLRNNYVPIKDMQPHGTEPIKPETVHQAQSDGMEFDPSRFK
jgi:hypothetical protein